VDVGRPRWGPCTACGGGPAAPDVVHRLRRGPAAVSLCLAPLQASTEPAEGRLTFTESRRRRVHVPRPKAGSPSPGRAEGACTSPGRKPCACTATFTATAPLAPQARRS
jgi:hypothetical protein